MGTDAWWPRALRVSGHVLGDHVGRHVYTVTCPSGGAVPWRGVARCGLPWRRLGGGIVGALCRVGTGQGVWGLSGVWSWGNVYWDVVWG